MDSNRPHIALAIGWVGTFFTFVAAHWSQLLGAAVGITTIVASLYAARASNTKRRFYEAEIKKLNDKP
jgi:Flp pilus assembly protein TadB